MSWQPINTAPKDGRWVRLKHKDTRAVAKWSQQLCKWSLGRKDENGRLEEKALGWEPVEWAPLEPAWA